MQLAIDGHTTYPCLWLRGICPLILTTVDTADIAHNRVYAYIGTVPQCGDWPSGTYFGDGSGGPHGSYPTLRRCGVGLCLLEPEGTLSFGVSYKLPGEIQTFPRSEVSALATLVEHACEGSHITYIGDNLPVVEMFNKGYDHCSTSANCDLFKDIFMHIKVKKINIEVNWIPSHTDTDPTKVLPAWATSFHVTGNNEADKLAESAALRAQLDLNSVSKVKHYTYLVAKIQLRFATIICNLPHRQKAHHLKAVKVLPTSFEVLFNSSAHTLSEDEGVLRCASCKSSIHINSSNVKQFLTSDCINHVPLSKYRPSKVGPPIRIGKQVTHHTHSLYNYRGFIFCNSCGFTGRAKLHKLAAECTHHKTSYAKELLGKLAKGKLPRWLNKWPDDCHPQLNVTQSVDISEDDSD